MKRFTVWHPFAIGLVPVLSMLSNNTAEMELLDAVQLAALALMLVLILLGICQLVLRDILRAGIIASGFTVSLFLPIIILSSPIIFVISPFYLLWVLRTWPGFVLWALGILFYTYFFAKKAAGVRKLTTILNIVSLCFISISISNIVIAKLSERIDWKGIHDQQQQEVLVPQTTPSPLPDIYYIIMDRYAGLETLKTIYSFDNREFLSYLEAKGFYVAMRSAANYPSTTHSLASSLNLQYINYLRMLVEPESNSWIPVQHLLQEHKVGQFLKSLGYRYIHLGSWWEPTRKNRSADENIYFNSFPESAYVLSSVTMLQPVCAALGVLDLRYEHWRGARRQFDRLLSTLETTGPKFVFTHFLLPHGPYVFRRDGAYLSLDQANKQPQEAHYINQLVYTNSMLHKTIDTLISRSKQPPIIVLQADEGPWSRRFQKEYKEFNWDKATLAEVNQKMKILNSFYLPGVDTRILYPTISPVNTFRVIFNLYFNTALPLLPDESFLYTSRRHPYNLRNITQYLNRD